MTQALSLEPITPRSEGREPLDAYYTDPALAKAIVAHIAEFVVWEGIHIGRILEPSCGKGAFVEAAREQWPDATIVTVDLNPEHSPTWCGDFLDFNEGGFDLILGNPPFSPAQAHVDHARSLLSPNGILSFLLRFGFAGSLERYDWFQAEKPDKTTMIVPRPTYTGGTTDNSEYAVFLWWARNFGRPHKTTALEWMKWREKKARGRK